jgi:ribonucleoside-diphosphate reductase alpha chain
MDVYVQGWKLGLKAIAIYRENSKRSQPLSTSKGGNTKAREADASGDGALREPEIVEKIVEREVEKVVYKPIRKRLPDERPSITHKFSIAGHEGYLHIGLYPDTSMPGEIFITMAKQGSTISGLMDTFATAISLSLQYGVPLEDLCAKFSHTRFEPSGFTNNKQIPIAKSIADYIFRYLAIKFLGRTPIGSDQEDLDPNHAVTAEIGRSGPAQDETQMRLEFGKDDSLVGQTVEAFMDSMERGHGAAPAKQAEGTFRNQEDAPPCYVCGAITVRAGACYSCASCGASNGCG